MQLASKERVLQEEYVTGAGVFASSSLHGHFDLEESGTSSRARRDPVSGSCACTTDQGSAVDQEASTSLMGLLDHSQWAYCRRVYYISTESSRSVSGVSACTDTGAAMSADADTDVAVPTGADTSVGDLVGVLIAK
ncbi:hypothetical protein F442_08260 [Phytophthora nicotianae P10297]|uniref:Uncharacterized protein n=1 Tax=Phytophthora nicotianae P10297 TaxID=1317064 RepID=W2ZEB4_PHYNI|nr:hypothetical protein F442_08260 [Phytophthora nicotianae P10297]